jgi:hypothetical protein
MFGHAVLVSIGGEALGVGGGHGEAVVVRKNLVVGLPGKGHRVC